MATMTDTDRSSGDIKKSVAQWLRGNDRPTALADYQRPYVWPESHVTAFTETILDALFPSETEGTEKKDTTERAPDIGVVIVETSSGRESVVDGQQRLLTFSLLIAELCPDKIFGTGKDAWGPSSRLRQLLRPRNLQSVLHARQAARTIRNLVSRRTGLQKLNSDEKIERLERVTFSVVSIKRSGENTDPAVRNFFEPLNTTAKPLNGGQILKAHHMGRIYEKNPTETWNLQSRYETWFRGHEEDKGLGLNAFVPFNFNWDEEISVERFIDSHGQDAYYKLGCGFVQAVQAMLLGQNKWWWEIASQGDERQAPFERLEGTPRADADKEDVREWRATDPLAFSEAEGFFRMVGRFARLYDAYCLELLKLYGRWPEKIRGRIVDRGLAEDDPDRRPARLVCRAACLMAAFGRSLSVWSKEENRLQTEPSLGRLCRWENKQRVEIAPEFRTAEAWLALPKEPRDLSNTYGTIPTALYAVALLWSDKFPQKEADDDIVRLLMVQLLFARPCSQWRSVWNALSVWQAVAAAQFSTNSKGALWRFLKTARFMGNDWPRELETTLDRMPGGREETQSPTTPAPEEELSTEERKEREERKQALTELRTILSQYLSF